MTRIWIAKAIAYEPGNYTLTVAFTDTGSATNHGTGAKLKIEAQNIKVEFLPRHYTTRTTNTLQVAKWVRAFSPSCLDGTGLA